MKPEVIDEAIFTFLAVTEDLPDDVGAGIGGLIVLGWAAPGAIPLLERVEAWVAQQSRPGMEGMRLLADLRLYLADGRP